MKDMALQEKVLQMSVTSLKIEGRKKSALYVAAVTDYYRRILDGKGADAEREELRLPASGRQEGAGPPEWQGL